MTFVVVHQGVGQLDEHPDNPRLAPGGGLGHRRSLLSVLDRDQNGLFSLFGSRKDANPCSVSGEWLPDGEGS